jgi:hypothetical protein
VADIEPRPETLARQRVRVHRDDVLKAGCFRAFGAELKRLCHLAFIHAIEEMAVVDQESGASAILEADFGQHEIEAEYLHVGDAFAPLPVDMDFELRAAAGFGDCQASGFLV